jgi:hypothetical protein
VGDDEELSVGVTVWVVSWTGVLADAVEVSVVVAGAVDWSTDGAGADWEVSVLVDVVVGAVEASTVLPDDVSGALGAVGAGASVGVELATAVVCVALVVVSVVVDVVSLSRSLIVPPRRLSTSASKPLSWSLSKLNDTVEKRVTPERRLGSIP